MPTLGMALHLALRIFPKRFKWVGPLLVRHLPAGWKVHLDTTDYGNTLVMIVTSPGGRRFPVVLEGEFVGGFYVKTDWNRVENKNEEMGKLLSSFVDRTVEDAT